MKKDNSFMNNKTLKSWGGIILAIAAGCLTVFLVIMNAVFSFPGSRASEKVMNLIMAALVYAVLGFVFAGIDRQTSWWWGIYLSLPAVSFLLVYMFAETDASFICAVYLAVTVLFASGAAFLRSKVKFGSGGKKE